MSVVCREGTTEKRGGWQGFSTSRHNCTPTAEVLEPEPRRDPAVPSSAAQNPWKRAETPTSKCCPRTQPVTTREASGTRTCPGKAAQSGPAMLYSRVGVVPLDAERFAPVGRLQQVKFQHERGVQGPPEEGVVAEHRHAHDGGVHHGILGEPARSNGALPLPCLAAAALLGLPGHPALTPREEQLCPARTVRSGTMGQSNAKAGIRQSTAGWEPNPSHCRQTQQLLEEQSRVSQPLSTGACGGPRGGGRT